ncbi:MAG: hypothetical protein R3Y36_00675 [Spirochaetales bacterium]
MWEKLSYKRQLPHELDLELHIDEMLSNCKYNLKNGHDMNKVLKSVQEVVYHYQSFRHIHEIFYKEPIENIVTVLKEVTQKLKMKQEGFDFDLFNFDKEMTTSEDLISLLFHFSRKGEQSKQSIIQILNLLRERQKTKYNIEKPKDKLNQDNFDFLKSKDEGFCINLFPATLQPFLYLQFLETKDLDTRYMYTKKKVKFVCEADRDFKNENINSINKTAGYNKALNSIYLYKMRNQYTHFSLDENVLRLRNPENYNELLSVLIEAYKNYYDEADKIARHWEKTGQEGSRLSENPHRLILPKYILHHISSIIEALCLKVHSKNSELSDEIKQTLLLKDFTFQRTDYKNLEKLLKNNKINFGIKSYCFAEEEKELVRKTIYKKYGESEIIVSLQAEEKEKEIFSYVENFENFIEDILNFLFTADCSTEDQYADSFLEKYHTESAFYILYLAQYFLNFNDDDMEGKNGL